MNNKHRRTLAAVFAEPVSATTDWSSIEALLVAVGCKVVEGSESRVRFEKDGEVVTFHHPHRGREAKRYQVRDARGYLRIGVVP